MITHNQNNSSSRKHLQAHSSHVECECDGSVHWWPDPGKLFICGHQVMYMYIPRCCFCRQALIFLAHLELASSNPTIYEFDVRIWNEQWHIIQHDVNCVYAPQIGPQCTHRTEVCM